MIITFNTVDFGKIEVDTTSAHVYFYKDDMGAELMKDGSFKHPFKGTEFQFHNGKPASLDVWMPRHIAYAVELQPLIY